MLDFVYFRNLIEEVNENKNIMLICHLASDCEVWLKCDVRVIEQFIDESGNRKTVGLVGKTDPSSYDRYVNIEQVLTLNVRNIGGK